jgi:hypothetical protein
MEFAPSSNLGYAFGVYKQSGSLNRKQKGLAAKQLASFGFDTSMIVKILNMSIKTVVKNVGYIDESHSRFNPQTLDGLVLVAVSYEDDQHISTKLVKMIVEWGTGLLEVSELCHIPIEELREALQNEVH